MFYFVQMFDRCLQNSRCECSVMRVLSNICKCFATNVRAKNGNVVLSSNVCAMFAKHYACSFCDIAISNILKCFATNIRSKNENVIFSTNACALFAHDLNFNVLYQTF